MRKIIDYKIIVASSSGLIANATAAGTKLEDSVRHMIAEGYEPIGGVAVVRSSGEVSFSQAMAKYESSRAPFGVLGLYSCQRCKSWVVFEDTSELVTPSL